MDASAFPTSHFPTIPQADLKKGEGKRTNWTSTKMNKKQQQDGEIGPYFVIYQI